MMGEPHIPYGDDTPCRGVWSIGDLGHRYDLRGIQLPPSYLSSHTPLHGDATLWDDRDPVGSMMGGNFIPYTRAYIPSDLSIPYHPHSVASPCNVCERGCGGDRVCLVGIDQEYTLCHGYLSPGYPLSTRSRYPRVYDGWEERI